MQIVNGDALQLGEQIRITQSLKQDLSLVLCKDGPPIGVSQSRDRRGRFPPDAIEQRGKRQLPNHRRSFQLLECSPTHRIDNEALSVGTEAAHVKFYRDGRSESVPCNALVRRLNRETRAQRRDLITGSPTLSKQIKVLFSEARHLGSPCPEDAQVFGSPRLIGNEFLNERHVEPYAVAQQFLLFGVDLVRRLAPFRPPSNNLGTN